MTGQRSLRWLVACLLVLVSASLSYAGDRDYWVYTRDGHEGHFVKTKGNKWTEKSSEGPTWHFVEVDRNRHYVELYDKSRDCTVRLHAKYYEVKFKNGKFEKLAEGRWTEK